MKKTIIILSYFLISLVYGQKTNLLGIKKLNKEELVTKVLLQLKIDLKNCKEEFIKTKILPNDNSKTIVIIPEVVNYEEEGGESYSLNSYILIVNSLNGTIESKFFESYKSNGWESNAIYITDISIDTAPYIVKKNTRAFGIRLSFSGSSSPNPYDAEYLSLFTQEDKQLKRILKNYETREYVGEWDMSCEGSSVTKNSLLVISKKKYNGYYEIIIKTTITETTTTTDKANNCIEKNNTTHTTAKLSMENDNYIITSK